MRKLVLSVVMLAVLAPVTADAGGWRVRYGGGARVGVGGGSGVVYRGSRVYGPQYRFRYRYWSPRVWRPHWYWGWWRPSWWNTYVYYEAPYYGGYAVETAPPPPGPRAPYEPTVGIGIRGSAATFGSDRPHSEGLGGVLRFRTRPVELELEAAYDRYSDDSVRRDTRVGAALVVPLFGTVLQPFVVGGLGVNFVDYNDGSDVRTQGYLSGGGGLALNLSRAFTLSLDARYVVRHFFDDRSGDVIPLRSGPPTDDGDKRETGVEGRLSAIFYF